MNKPMRCVYCNTIIEEDEPYLSDGDENFIHTSCAYDNMVENHFEEDQLLD